MSPSSATAGSSSHRLRLNGPGREILVLLFLALIALIPRLYRIESAPPGLNGDELFNAIDALRLGPGQWHKFINAWNAILMPLT